MPTIDLFLKSYKKDFWLLYFALATIKKNVTGYDNLILLIPEHEKHEFDTRNLPERTLIHYVKDDFGDGWLRQQWFKISAYNYSFSDYIMFTDSDCFFTYPVDIRDAINNGKPEILYTSWDKVDQAITWKEPTERILGCPAKFEYMRRNQLCYHRDSLIHIGQWRPDLETLIMRSEKFSEFNLIGAYCNVFENDKYTWTNTDDWQYIPPLAEQVWSHSNKEKGASETHHLEYIRLLETLLKAFNIIVP